MRPPEQLDPSAPSAPAHHYRESGLDNVWLQSGFEYLNTDYGPGLRIHNMDQLHERIAAALLDLPRALRACELKFLRIEADLSIEALATLLNQPAAAVAAWESGERAISAEESTRIREWYATHTGIDSTPNQSLNEALPDVSSAAGDSLHLRYLDPHWALAPGAITVGFL